MYKNSFKLIREVKITITVKHHYIAEMQKTDKAKGLQGYTDTRAPYTASVRISFEIFTLENCLTVSVQAEYIHIYICIRFSNSTPRYISKIVHTCVHQNTSTKIFRAAVSITDRNWQ